MANTQASNNPFPSILVVEGTEPTAPSAGQQRLYVDSTTHTLKRTDSAGVDVDLEASSGLSDPMTSRGDLIIRNASNVTARLAKGSALQVLTSDGTDVAWATPAAGVQGCAVASKQGSGSGDYSTSSATYVDVDGTNLAITPTLAQSGDILRIEATFVVFSTSAVNTGVTFSIAGTDVGDTLGLAFAGSTAALAYTLVYHYTMPSGTQPAIKLRYKSAGTGTIYNRTAVVRPRMSVTNMSRGGTL